MHVTFVAKLVAALFIADSFVSPALSAPLVYVDPYWLIYSRISNITFDRQGCCRTREWLAHVSQCCGY